MLNKTHKPKRMFRMVTNVAAGGYWHSITPPNGIESISFSLKHISEVRLFVDGHNLLPCSSIKELEEAMRIIPWYNRISFHKGAATVRLDDIEPTNHVELSVYCEKKGNINFFCLTK